MLTSRVRQLKTNSFARWLGVICLVAVLLRLIWLGLTANVPIQAADVSDQANYLNRALEFSQGAGYSELYYPPLYPLFLGVIMTIQKWFGLTGIPIRVLMGTVQTSLSVAVMIMTALLGARRFSPRVGLVAASFIAIWPNYIANVGTLMTEQLSTPLFLAGTLTLLWDKQPTRRNILLAGGFYGLSVLARPALLPILPMACVVFMLNRTGWRIWLRQSAWFIGVALLVISPWLMYTTALTGSPTLGIAGGFNLCLGNNDLGLTSWDQRSIDAYCPMPQNVADDQELYAKSLDWMRDHPQRQPQLIAERTFNIFFVDFSASGLYPTNNSWQVRLIPRPVFYGVGFIWWLCLLGWAIGGLVRLKDHRMRTCLVLIGFATIAIPLISVGQDRYHDALVPMMALTAAYGSLRAGTLRARLIERFSRSKAAARITQ